MDREWKVYLSGEIHSQWREEIIKKASELDLPVSFSGPQAIHEKSDECGVKILGEESSSFWKDQKASGINSIRTKTLLKEADLVVVKFGEKYRQWNAAFEAGMAAAFDIPLVTLHPESHDHALKEVDSAAVATCRDPCLYSRFFSLCYSWGAVTQKNLEILCLCFY